MRLPAILICFALIPPAFVYAGEPLMVSAAASLSEALKEIDEAFEKDTGIKVELNLGASNQLARQIVEGSPADVFFPADEATMNSLSKKALIAGESLFPVLSNSLVVIVPADNKQDIHTAKDLAGGKIRRIALGDPKAVPAGVYARKWLEKAGLWKVVGEKVISAESVRAALAMVESGNVEAGVVYKTDAAISKKVTIAFEVSPDEGPEIVYPVAILKESKHPSEAGKYLLYLKTGFAKNTFLRRGFTVPDFKGN